MIQERSPNQNGIEGEGFDISPEIILANKETVTDFFGDNREKWYSLLSRSGTLHKKVVLTIREEIPSDSDKEVPMPVSELPLDPNVINLERAKSITDFFKEYPAALVDFIEYSKWYSKTN